MLVSLDEFGLERPDRRLHERVVQGIADGADGACDPGVARAGFGLRLARVGLQWVDASTEDVVTIVGGLRTGNRVCAAWVLSLPRAVGRKASPFGVLIWRQLDMASPSRSVAEVDGGVSSRAGGHRSPIPCCG
jgi:hypothetical protein